jgi:hypothetical protein
LRLTIRPSLTFCVVVVGAGLIAAPVSPSPGAQAPAVRLTSGDTADSPLGDGTALVVGPSGIPIPPQGYLDAVDALYLAPRGFTGTIEPVDTPEALYPITGVKSLPFDTSEAQGQQILDTAVLQQINEGHVDAANPVVVFGYSQSSVISAQLMPELAKQGVPSDDVHFVLVADESNPNGGVLSSFDIPVGAHPSVPALGVTFTGAQPSDLYPTDDYALEYDGFADFPRYPIDELSTLNALFGLVFQHVTYADLTPEQIADAVALPTSAADTLTNYYVIPDPYLPLLQPLLVIPGIGKPLYDLLEPDMRILVNLGYGSITEGWNQGPADVETPVGLFPTNIDPTQLSTALSNGAQQGISDALRDLQNPDTAQLGSQLTMLFDNPAGIPALSGLVSGAGTFGLTDTANPSLLDLVKGFLSGFANFPISDATLQSSPADIINDLTGTVSADYASLLPVADTINALFTSLPAAGLNLLADTFASGNLTEGIDELVGGLAGAVPFALAVGAVPPIGEALGGTLVNLVDLIPGT